MSKIFNKTKNSIKDIHWPKPKAVVSDTTFTVSVTAILAILVNWWMQAIEFVINQIVSLF